MMDYKFTMSCHRMDKLLELRAKLNTIAHCANS